MTEKNQRMLSLEQTHRRILDEAENLFMSEGFKRTSTREIAKRCNITQPNLYHHFKNKKQIYLAVIERLIQRVQVELTEIQKTAAPVQVKIKAMVKVLLEKHPTNLFRMLQDMSKELDQEEYQKMYRWFHATYLENFMRVLAEGSKDALELREEVQLEQAASFLLYTISSIMEIQTTYQTKQSEAKVAQMIDLALFGIYQKTEGEK